MYDVFISYRRKDAYAEAFLLHRDLSDKGYRVFFDHKSLGQGDYLHNIQEQIRTCDSVIVVLSESSFESRIYKSNDVYGNEIRWALEYKKRIIGIMLEGFYDFPLHLPADIEQIRNVHCLRLHIGYYDALVSELVSGRFLPLSPQATQTTPSEDAVQALIPKELKRIAILPSEQRVQYTQLLLQIMNSFNNSPACMRFYQYIDLCDRNRGDSTLPEYQGEIPADLTTYLSFFETLYIIVGSGTIDLSVLDFAYRFRFFAGCNTLLMQQSELLPLGYQYPNILSLYNIWSDYIVDHYDHSIKYDSIADLIPLYQWDLQKRYAAYSFAQKMSTPMRIRFLNRNLCWLNATLRKMDKRDLGDSMTFQREVIGGIADNDTSNIFEPLTEQEMYKSLEQDCCVGLYAEERLIAQMNLILEPAASENLVLDLPDPAPYLNAGILDYVVVHPDVRGFSVQKTFLFLAECIGMNNNKSGICAVTSPLNSHSIKNFFSQMYRVVDTREKYHSVRHYMWKPLK